MFDRPILPKSWLARVGASAAVFTAVLLGAGSATADVKIRVGSSQTLGEAPFYVAAEKGYFKDEGLDVQLVPVRAGPAGLSAVAAGEVDVVNTIPGSGLFNAFKQGIPLKVVAGAANTIGTVIARKELINNGILKTFADLKGRSLALPTPVSIHHIWVEKGAQQSGMTRNDIKLTYMSFPDMMGALGNKRIDAAYLPEPFATNAVEKLNCVRWLDPNPIHPGMVVTIWIYSERIAIQEPELGRKFMVALVRGMHDFLDGIFANKNRKAVVAALAKHTRIKDTSLYDRIEFPKIAPNGELGLKSLQETLDWLQTKGLVRSPPDLNDVVDTSFVEYAVAKVGQYKR